MRFRSLVIRA